VELTATHDAGTEFLGWLGECTGLDPTCELVMGTDITLGFVSLASGSLQAQTALGGADPEAIFDLNVQDGLVGIIGRFEGTTDLGAGNMTSAGMGDAFLALYDRTNNMTVQWVNQYGGADEDAGKSLAISATEIAVGVSYRSGAIDPGNGSPTGNAGETDALITGAEVDDGAYAYLLGANSADDDEIVAYDRDPNGFAVGVGRRGDDIRLMRFRRLVTDIASTLNAGGVDIAVDVSAADGDITIVGQYIENDGPESFVAKFSGDDLSSIYANFYNGDGLDEAQAVVTDPEDGSVYVAGVFTDGVDFGTGPLMGAGGTDVFVLKLDAAGDPVWVKSFGDAEDESVSSLTLDADGHPVLIGTYAGAFGLGGFSFASAGGTDVFVGSLDAATGDHRWSRRFGGTEDDVGVSVALDADGTVLAAGNFRGTATFGSETLTATGETDVFITELAP
jgi:hypothetical protein